LFGGNNPFSGVFYTDQTWEWDGFLWTEMNPPTRPPERRGAAMAYDSRRGVCVMFGGGTNIFQHQLPFNDTWEWDGITWTMRQANDPLLPDRPPPLHGQLMAFDSSRGRTVLIATSWRENGDYIPCTYTWEWDGTNWTTFYTAPPPRSGGVLVYDPVRRVTVLFGGNGWFDPLLNDTWTWDGERWALVSTSGPPPREEHAMAFDVRRQVMVMVGGRWGDATENYNDTWEWNGTSWSLQATAGTFGLTARRLHQMWYEPGQERLMVLGGSYSYRAADGSYVHTIVDDLFEGRLPGRWIDFNYAGQPAWPENGDFQTPYNSLAEAVEAARPGCTLIFKEGKHNESLTITKPLELDAYQGPATIGQISSLP
jgi:hypothetical protein